MPAFTLQGRPVIATGNQARDTQSGSRSDDRLGMVWNFLTTAKLNQFGISKCGTDKASAVKSLMTCSVFIPSCLRVSSMENDQ